MIGGEQAANSGADELRIRDLIAFLWSSRWILLIMGAAGTALAAGLAWYVPPRYEASVLLLPVSNQSSNSGLGGLASVVSQLGGATGFAGLNVGASGGSRAEAIATLQSQSMAQKYIADHNLLPALFSDLWDSTRQQWKSQDSKTIPSLWQGMVYFQKQIVSVTENAKTGLVLLTVTWKDPKTAATWANELVTETNRYLREKAIHESEKNMAYLNEQAAATASVEVRGAVYAVLETEIKKAMLARGSEEFALKVVDPAIPTERPSYPRPHFWMLGGLVIGLLFGAIVSGIRVASRQPSAAPR